jgi:O-antigen/teichoic acid export membrane protein
MKKGLFQVLIANIISLVISLIMNFFVPKYLSIHSYAMYKTYALYIIYAGFFHLGYADGMYLKYGGKDINKIDKKELADNYKNYIYLILLMAAIVFSVGLLVHDNIIIAFSFGLISANILGYLKNLYQATGEFGAYSKATNFERIGVLVFTLFFLLIIRTDNYVIYIAIQVAVGLTVALYLSLRLEHRLHFFKLGRFSKKEYRENIPAGLILMLGNFSSNVFTGLDRWFIKFLMSTTPFALYSFASGLLNLLNVFITPITVSLYNFFCKGIDDKHIKKLKRLVLAWGLLLIAAGYPVKFILIHYLDKYIDANRVIYILFSAQVFIAIIQGVYVNLYKARKQQNKYFIQMLIMLAVGFVTNAGFYAVYHSMDAFAWATLFTYFVWFLVCEIQNPELRYGVKEYIVMIVLMAAAIITGYAMPPVAGLLVYLVLYVVLVAVLMPDVMQFAVENISEVPEKLRKRQQRR